MKPLGMRTWKWLARRAMGRPSVPWLGLGGHVNSVCGGPGGVGGGSANSGNPAGRPAAKGKVGGGTVIQATP